MGESNEKTISIKRLNKDELEFQKVVQANFASLAKLIRKDLNNDRQTQAFFNKNFDRDKVQDWLANPERHQKRLRHLVRFLFVSSSHFKRAVMYFATLPMWKYTVEMYGCTDFEKLKPDNVKKSFFETIRFLEVMNVEHEFAKISLICWLEDAFFGYEYRLEDSYLIQPLDPDFCHINGTEDGVLTFEFDFSYFNNRESELSKYDSEFEEKYRLYKSNRKEYRWQELDSDRAICWKINENVDFCVPPLSGVLTSLYDIEDFKQLKKAKTELENYLILTFGIPYRKDKDSKENAFALSLDKALEFYNLALSELPEQVGALLSPFDKVDAIRVDKSEKTVNTVEEAENAFYNDAGISKVLFNSSANGASLTKSIQIDEAMVFKFIKQAERWVNRKLKGFCKGILFKTHFLEMTYMSRDDYIKNMKEAAQSGLPCKLRYAASIGLTPSAIEHNHFIEEILGLPDKWRPLQSSHTTSGGRPQNDEDSLTEGGEEARARDTNNPDNRDY